MSSKPELTTPPNTYEEGGDRGVDSAKVSAATEAFSNYMTDIGNTFSGFKTSITGYSDAFYGDSASRVKGYVDGVIDKCQELMEELNEFEPKVQEAMENYASQAETVYGDIGSVGSN